MMWDVVIWPELGDQVTLVATLQELRNLGINPMVARNLKKQQVCGIVTEINEIPVKAGRQASKLISHVIVAFGAYDLYFPLNSWQRYLKVVE